MGKGIPVSRSHDRRGPNVEKKRGVGIGEDRGMGGCEGGNVFELSAVALRLLVEGVGR
jgi:hypothetical protein